MKKLLLLIITSVLLCSCNQIKYGDVFKITDDFVEQLHTRYESYGSLGGFKHTQFTEDLEYKIVPIGRLINVRIERVASDEEYEDLRRELELHYSKDYRVNDVYRNQAGTIMIDCRN